MELRKIQCVRIVLPEILYYTFEDLESLAQTDEKVFYLLSHKKPQTQVFACKIAKPGVLRLSPCNNEYLYRYSIHNKKPSLVIDSLNKEESLDTVKALAKTALDLGCQGLVVEKKMIKFLKLC